MLYIIYIITYRTLSLFVYKQLLISLIYGKSKIKTKYITTTTKPHAVFNYKVCFSRSNLISISQLWIVSIKNVKTEKCNVNQRGKEWNTCHPLFVVFWRNIPASFGQFCWGGSKFITDHLHSFCARRWTDNIVDSLPMFSVDTHRF